MPNNNPSPKDKIFCWIKYTESDECWSIISPLYSDFTECIDHASAFPGAVMMEKVWVANPQVAEKLT